MSIASFMSYLLSASLMTVMSFALGFLMFKLAGVNKGSVRTFFGLFMSTFLGQIVLTSMFAIYTTKGLTTLVGPVILLALIFLWKKGKNIQFVEPRTERHPISKIALWFVGFHLLSFLVLALKYYYPSQNLMFIVNADYALFAERADYIYKAGFENRSGGANVVSTLYHGVAPYHYYDLYIAKLNSLLFSQKTLFTYAVSGLITGGFILATGLLALIEHYTKHINMRHLALAFVFNYCVGYTLPLYYTNESISGLLIGSFDHPAVAPAILLKATVIHTFVVASLLMALKNFRVGLFAVLLMLPNINIVLAFGVIPTLGLISLYNFLKRRSRENLMILGMSGFTGLFILLFYVLFKAQVVQNQSLIMNFEGFKDVLNVGLYSGKYFFRSVVFYFPIIPLLYWYFKRSEEHSLSKIWILNLGAILITALFFGSVFHMNFDGIQLYTNIARAVFLTSIFWLSVYFVHNGKTHQRRYAIAFMSALIVIGILSQALYIGNKSYDNKDHALRYSKETIEKVGEIAQKRNCEQLRIATLRQNYSRYPYCIDLFSNLSNGVTIYDINVHSYNIDNLDWNKINIPMVLQSSAFSQFRLEHIDMPDDSLDLVFLRTMEVDIVVREASTPVPTTLGPIIKQRWRDEHFPIELIELR